MFKKILLVKIAYRLFGGQAKQIVANNKDTKDLIDLTDQKASQNKSTLQAVWEQLKLLLQMLNSYRKGEYREISKGTILIIVIGFLYFLSPVDVIPDFLVGVGLLDDAALIGFIAKQIKQDIRLYQHWLEKKES